MNLNYNHRLTVHIAILDRLDYLRERKTMYEGWMRESTLAPCYTDIYNSIVADIKALEEVLDELDKF